MVRVLENHDLGQLDAQSGRPTSHQQNTSLSFLPSGVPSAQKIQPIDVPLCNQLSELGVTVASQEFDRVGRHYCEAKRNNKSGCRYINKGFNSGEVTVKAKPAKPDLEACACDAGQGPRRAQFRENKVPYSEP